MNEHDSPALQVLDWDGLQDRLGGDAVLIAELAAMLVEDAPRLAEECDQALSTGDWTTAYRLAHTLKGAAGNICAHRVAAAASELERLTRHPRTPDAFTAGAALQQEVRLLVPALRELHAAFSLPPGPEGRPS